MVIIKVYVGSETSFNLSFILFFTPGLVLYYQEFPGNSFFAVILTIIYVKKKKVLLFYNILYWHFPKYIFNLKSSEVLLLEEFEVIRQQQDSSYIGTNNNTDRYRRD